MGRRFSPEIHVSFHIPSTPLLFHHVILRQMPIIARTMTRFSVPGIRHRGGAGPSGIPVMKQGIAGLDLFENPIYPSPMSEQHGPFHRHGRPGGPGCRVLTIPIKGVSPEGVEMDGSLFDAGTDATEIELLRTVAGTLGVNWGHDEFGWWAAVPVKIPAQPGSGNPSPD